jgi:hypothetical protein
MILMPSNNTGMVVNELFDKFPDRIARLLNPHRISATQFNGKYAVDNAAFSRFDEPQFFKLLDACPKDNPPMFVVAPDVYNSRLKEYGFPLAFVAQDGCTPDKIPEDCDWIFIGGTNGWKIDNIKPYIGILPVHVGRVNSLWFLEYCESLGVTSVDGTGWMRARGRQFYDMMDWFNNRKDQRELWPVDQN